jgi:hypothetical protein
MKRLALLGVCTLGFAAFTACGGADSSQLFDDAGNPIQDATQQDSAKQDSGPTPDSSPVEDVVVVDVNVPDVPVGPPDSKIHCGTTSCSAQTQVCCATVGNTITFACVSSLADCGGDSQIPITCSSGDNCASQGNAGFICCGSDNGPTNPNPNCNGFSSASQVQCQATCDANVGEFEIGCNTQTQNCVDTSQQCITSQCTLPGYTLCR